MKYILLLFSVIFFNNSYAQDNNSSGNNTKKIFVRLYNSNNEQIGKGDLLYGSDSSIEVKRNSRLNTFPVQQVAYIKTRRSVGHSILIGAAVGTATGIILIAASAGANTQNSEGTAASFGEALGGVAAPFVGVAAGSIAAAFRKRETIIVNGSAEQWKDARKKLLALQ
jgi:hypothetical protein